MDAGETRSMRSKEDAEDYRYFPDPDLLPLDLDEAWIAEIAESMPEMPDARKQRFMHDHGLSSYDAGVLVAERDNANFFEEVARGRDSKLAANWVMTELFGRLNHEGIGVADSPVGADALGGLIDLIVDGTISGRIAKDVFAEMFATNRGRRHDRRGTGSEAGDGYGPDRGSCRRCAGGPS